MFCIGCAICFLADLIHIKKDSSLIAISGAFVTIPTTLITRMQNIEGYSEDILVAYVNDGENKSLETVTITDDLYPARIVPNAFLNEYSWKYYIQEWCGFLAQEVDSDKRKELEESEEVKKMPVYPDDGSIKIIDGILVVKIAP